MIDEFGQNISTESIPELAEPLVPCLDTSASPFQQESRSKKKKHHKVKGKKALHKALKKAERERDQLLWYSGQLTKENDYLKRSISLAISISRGQFDTDLSENTLRLLPPGRKGRGR